MTTAYIAQVDLPEGIRYVGKQGRLIKVPHFWTTNNVWRLKHYFNLSRYAHYNRWQPKHAGSTTIIKTEGLDLGLRRSLAAPLSYDEFMATDASRSALLGNKNACYALKAKDGSLFKVRGYHKAPRLWDKAGDLRRYMSTSYQPFKTYDGATVLEIEYGPDKLTPTKITEHKALEFWLRSPSARQNATRRYRSELSTFQQHPTLAKNEHV